MEERTSPTQHSFELWSRFSALTQLAVSKGASALHQVLAVTFSQGLVPLGCTLHALVPSKGTVEAAMQRKHTCISASYLYWPKVVRTLVLNLRHL